MFLYLTSAKISKKSYLFSLKGILSFITAWRTLSKMKEALINFQKVTKPSELTNLWMVEYIAKSGHQEQKQCFSQVTSVSIFRNISSFLHCILDQYPLLLKTVLWLWWNSNIKNVMSWLAGIVEFHNLDLQ